MFKWLKRLKNIELEETSNLNGLYTARIGDLKKIDKAIGKINKNIETINTTIGNINNRIDQFPSPNHIAVKNETNTFEEIQEIKTTSPYLAFRKPNNQRKGYIGTPASSSNDIELKAETNSLMLNANHNINLTSGNGYNTLIDKDPNVDNAVANKRYVDTQIAAVATPDLTPYARKDQENVFSQKQTVNNEIVARSGEVETVTWKPTSIVNIEHMQSMSYARKSESNTFIPVQQFQDIRITDNISGPPNRNPKYSNEYVTKYYTNKFYNNSRWWIKDGWYKMEMWKRTWGSIYSYDLNGNISFNVSGDMKKGWYLIIMYVYEIGSGNRDRTDWCRLQFPIFGEVTSSGTLQIWLSGQIISGTDLKVGSDGSFMGNVKIRFGYMEMITNATKDRIGVIKKSKDDVGYSYNVIQDKFKEPS